MRWERFSRHLRVSDPDMHHGTCVTYVPCCMPGSLTSCFLWIRWRGKRSRHSRCMHNPQFYVSGKRPMPVNVIINTEQGVANLVHNVRHTLYCWIIGLYAASCTRKCVGDSNHIKGDLLSTVCRTFGWVLFWFGSGRFTYIVQGFFTSTVVSL